ncbi:MAG: putative tubulin polyglutamylase, partial [Streblomastix strix]
DAQVVQRYVDKPFLIDGLKFDLRIYVIITSVTPLEIWLGREGLARFCTKKYEGEINKKNIENIYMHLTNYAVNKNSDSFVRAEDTQNEEKASKRSLGSVTKLLQSRGSNTDRLWESITSVIVRTCIAIHPSLVNSYAIYASEADNAINKGISNGESDLVSAFNLSRSASHFSPIPEEHIQRKQEQKTDNTQNQSIDDQFLKYEYRQNQIREINRQKIPSSQCFHIIGFDILLDYRLRPWLLEINHSPSFVTDSDLDHVVKSRAISGAFKMCVIDRKMN